MTDAPFVPFTDDDLTAQTRRPFLKEGWYRGRVVTAGPVEAFESTGTMYVPMIIAPLDAEGETQTPTIRHRLVIPKANPDVEGHRPPRTLGFWTSYLRVTNPNMPSFPKKAGSVYITDDGEELTRGEYLEACDNVRRWTYSKIDEVQQDAEGLLDDEFFFLVAKNSRGYTEVKALRSVDSEPDEDVITANFSG